jgi:hypothetical protein
VQLDASKEEKGGDHKRGIQGSAVASANPEPSTPRSGAPLQAATLAARRTDRSHNIPVILVHPQIPQAQTLSFPSPRICRLRPATPRLYRGGFTK